MTAPTENTITERHASLWKKLSTWFDALAHAMDYDPQAANINYLKAEVDQLKARLEKVESVNHETVRLHDPS